MGFKKTQPFPDRYFHTGSCYPTVWTSFIQHYLNLS